MYVSKCQCSKDFPEEPFAMLSGTTSQNCMFGTCRRPQKSHFPTPLRRFILHPPKCLMCLLKAEMCCLIDMSLLFACLESSAQCSLCWMLLQLPATSLCVSRFSISHKNAALFSHQLRATRARSHTDKNSYCSQLYMMCVCHLAQGSC